MREILATGHTLSEAYHKALVKLSGEPSGECGMTMEVLNPVQEPRISRLFPGGPYDLMRYVFEMTEGIMDFEIERGNWHYTYHQRFAPWIDGVVDELMWNPKSRRACISVRDNAADEGSADPACLQSMQFMIRDGRLDMHVLFRSNDAVRATFMNAFALICIQEKMAYVLNVKVGRYVHRATNFHVYPECKDMLEAYVKRIFSGKDLYYEYGGDFGRQMADSIPDICRMVEKQKRKGRNYD